MAETAKRGGKEGGGMVRSRLIRLSRPRLAGSLLAQGAIMQIDVPNLIFSVVAAGGGGALIAFGIFKTLGTKWLDSRFAAQLEEQRAKYATETEHLRFKIAGMLDRTTKLNQREFEVLPDIWAKADEAHRHAASLVGRWRKYPDFSRLSGGAFETQLKESPLEDWQRVEMRALPASERNAYYSERMKWIELYRAKVASHDFSKALSTNGIYLHPDTFAQIDAFATMIFEAVRDWGLDAEMRSIGAGAGEEEDGPIHRYRANGEASFSALGKYLRDRYWNVPAL